MFTYCSFEPFSLLRLGCTGISGVQVGDSAKQMDHWTSRQSAVRRGDVGEWSFRN